MSMYKLKNKKEMSGLEDWHKPEYAEDPDHAPKRFKKPPKRFEAGFLAKMDRRTEVYGILHSAYREVLDDMGGEESLSHIQVALAERFVFLEFVLRAMEQRIAKNPKKSEEMLSRWIQALNSLTGLAKAIGLEKRAKKAITLKSYVREKSG